MREPHAVVVEYKFVKVRVKHSLEHVWNNLAKSFRASQYDVGIVSSKDHRHSDILADSATTLCVHC